MRRAYPPRTGVIRYSRPPGRFAPSRRSHGPAEPGKGFIRMTEPVERPAYDPEFARRAPRLFLMAVVRAILPSLFVDVGVTMAVYYVLLPHFAKTSLWPLIGASLVPVASNVYVFLKDRKLDMVGILVLVGIVGSVLGIAFGGTQRLLLIRESFITALIGIALMVSNARPKPLGYYIVYEFMTANESLNPVPFKRLWESRSFRWTIRRGTFLWGLILVGEFALRCFMAFTLPVSLVLGLGPLIFNVLLLGSGVISAFGMSRAIQSALIEPRDRQSDDSTAARDVG